MRNCIVIMNLANLTGFLNQSNPSGKMRIDYGALLKHVTGDRNLIGAFCVSQQDIKKSMSKPLTELQTNQRFVQTLKAFNWEPIRVAYNSETADVSNIVNSLWSNISELISTAGQYTIDPSSIDIVFINGSNAWTPVVDYFFSAGFSVEVCYPKKSTSRFLYSNYAFWDITSFLTSIQTASVQEVYNNG